MIWIYFPILFIISIIDIRTKKIPDGWNLTVALIGISFTAHLVVVMKKSLWLGIGGTLLVFFCLLAVAAITHGSLGGGDIKLATALSLPISTLGVEQLVLAWLVIGMTCVPILGLAAIRAISWNSRIPFAPSLALGYLAAMV
jgi:leader peptidase (prepilin peptidase)/N-methyltransferase